MPQSSKLIESELTGLDEIRIALKKVEELRQSGVDAYIEILNTEVDSRPAVILCSFKELQEYITQRYSKMLVDGVDSAIPLDDFERLVQETRTRLLADIELIRAQIRMK